MKRNNLGFTMVEMIAAVCILSIVSIMLLMFVSAGTVNYTKTGNTVAVQKEAQMAMNQITELLIDATNGVTYSVNNTIVDSDDHFIMGTAEEVDHKTVCVFNRGDTTAGGNPTFIRSEVKWEKNSKKLLYSEYKLEKNHSGSYTTTLLEENSLLAENVESFSVDLTQVDTNQSVTVQIGFNVKNQKFDAKKTVTLRNQIVINKGLDETFEEKETLLTATVDDVILNPSEVHVEQGSTYNEFQVTVVGQNSPGQEVEWEIANGADLTDAEGTTIDTSGRLKIGANETCEVIKIKATSIVSKRQAGADTSQYVSDTAEVYNKYIRSDAPVSISDVKTEPNLTATAKIHINGVNLEGTEDYSDRITVELYDGDKKLSQSEMQTGALKKIESDAVNAISSYEVDITGSSDYLNKKLTIKAIIDGKGSAEAQLEFREAVLSQISVEALNEEGKWLEYRNGEERVSKRGEIVQFRIAAVYTYDDGTEDTVYITSADKEWSATEWTAAFSGNNALGNRVQNNLNASGSLTIGADKSAFGYSSEYAFYVNAAYGGKSAKVKLVLPAVKLLILNQHTDTQIRMGMVVGTSGNKRAATVGFRLSGLVADAATIQCRLVEDSNLKVERIASTNTFSVYTYTEGTDSVSFYLEQDSDIFATLDIAAYNPNVKDGSTTLPYYVPADNASRVFFNQSQKEYYDLYGNVFLYPEKNKMTFNGTTYTYQTKSKVWVKE